MAWHFEKMLFGEFNYYFGDIKRDKITCFSRLKICDGEITS